MQQLHVEDLVHAPLTYRLVNVRQGTRVSHWQDYNQGESIATLVERSLTQGAVDRRVERHESNKANERFQNQVALGIGVYHAIPLGAAADAAAQKDWTGFGLAITGDAIFFATLGTYTTAAKASHAVMAAFRGTAGLGSLGLGVYHLNEGAHAENGIEAAAHYGEATLRLAGAFVGLRGSLQSYRAMRAEGSIAPSSATEGIYEFTASSGKQYVGQSGNIPGRIGRHLGTGKLSPGDLPTVRTNEVLGGKTAREVAEQLRINELGGVRNLENIRNAIGANRQHLLPP